MYHNVQPGAGCARLPGGARGEELNLTTRTSDPIVVSERVLECMGELTARERQVARALLAKFPVAGLDTVSNFARQTGVSTATVLRFVNKLGFPIYAEFQAALRSQLEATLQSPVTRFDDQAAQAGRPPAPYLGEYVNGVIANVQRAARMLPSGEFDSIVDLLSDNRRDIYVIGGRYTSSLGRYFVDLLKAIRPRAHYIDGQTQKWAHYLLDVGKKSIVVVFDTRRYQEDVVAFAGAAADRGATVVLFTDQWQSDIARVASRVISFPVESLSLFDSFAAGLVLAEALVGAAAVRLGPAAKARIIELEDLRRPLLPGHGKTNSSKEVT